MVRSSAKTVKQYLDPLPGDRRKVVARVRQCIRENLPGGYREVMDWGMITNEVPLKRFADTYNKKPLMYMALAAQKHHNAIYSMTAYAGSKYLKLLESGYNKAGIKLDMGECCIRFRTLDNVHLPTIGKLVAACEMEEFIKIYQGSRK